MPPRGGVSPFVCVFNWQPRGKKLVPEPLRAASGHHMLHWRGPSVRVCVCDLYSTVNKSILLYSTVLKLEHCNGATRSIFRRQNLMIAFRL